MTARGAIRTSLRTSFTASIGFILLNLICILGGLMFSFLLSFLTQMAVLEVLWVSDRALAVFLRLEMLYVEC